MTETQLLSDNTLSAIRTAQRLGLWDAEGSGNKTIGELLDHIEAQAERIEELENTVGSLSDALSVYT